MEYSIDEKICIAMSRTEDVKYRNKLRDTMNLDLVDDKAELESFIRNCTEQGIVIVTMKSERYPKSLLNLEAPPIVLYCKGNLGLLEKPAVAIVGTRDCTRYGQDVATRFAKEFAGRGLVVVSGLADGIDAAAHLGAGIENTIGVLGNGLNVFYPKGNTKLQKDMFQKGLVISEYLPNTPVARYNFPWRNRIVAGLSQALLIVEADIKSGTMITKDWALDLGLDVYSVPGPIYSTASRGTNHMIKEGGLIATSPDDVLATFGAFEKSKEAEATYIQLSFEEKMVIDMLRRGEQHFDDIVTELNLKPSKCVTLLTNMEIRGLIDKLPGNFFAFNQQ
ncbi:MAG: DNA-processing protein DprA [Firmicutes bacterium]|nr:DNA-processing protein DprA [Bacillota bacterium]